MGLFDRFHRKPQTLIPEDLPDSPIHWQAGDKAVCVSGDMWISRLPYLVLVPGPQYGDQCTVSRVILVERRQFLGFAEFGNGIYAACYFERPRAVGEERGMKALRGLLKTKPATPRVSDPVLVGVSELPSSAMNQTPAATECRGGRYPEFAARGSDTPVEGLRFPSAGAPDEREEVLADESLCR